MYIINKIGIALLVIQVFCTYTLNTNSSCDKMDCCGRSESAPIKSCHCSANHDQHTLKNNVSCNCPANTNVQTPLPGSPVPESDIKYVIQKLNKTFNNLKQYKSTDLAWSCSGRVRQAPIMDRYPLLDTYLLNCRFLI